MSEGACSAIRAQRVHVACRLSQDGASHRRYASLDVAMRKLRLSSDDGSSSFYSPGASSDAESCAPATRQPSAERALSSSRFSTLTSVRRAPVRVDPSPFWRDCLHLIL